MSKNTAIHGLMRSILGASLALLLTLGCSPSWAQTSSTMNIDHLKTGFALSGSHTSQRCENCHINGVFKGTPRDCASCHTGIARRAPTQVVVKPQQHFATQLNCDSCHNQLTFSGAKFNHMGVAPGACATCHNGFTTSGKPSGHIVTSLPCSACHRTTAWVPTLKPDHSQFTVATVCSTCHNGSTATGKTATHIPTPANCFNCHNTNGWKPTKWNHTNDLTPVANRCATCHTGSYPPADGKTSNHIPYQVLSGVGNPNCDTCHKAGVVSWFPGKFHSNVPVTMQCATCHLSSMYGLTSKPATATHAMVSGNCEACHKTTSSWISSKPDHSLFPPGTNCAGCHNGTSATGKTSNHIPYQVLAGVAISNCDTCHKTGYVSWFPGKFHSNVSVTMQCATCHLSSMYGLTSKPATATHATVTGFCENCHKSTSTWLSVQFTHSPANAVGTGTCDTCHNGMTALGKPVTHIPVTTGPTKCDSCHLGQVTFTAPYTMNHAVVAATTCKTCHNGSYTSVGTQGALAKPGNHIPEATQLLNGSTMDCKDCHSSTTSFTTEKMNHNSSAGSGSGWCIGCHATGTSYLGTMQKMALNHRGGTSTKTDCSQSGCHRPLGNTGSSYTKWN